MAWLTGWGFRKPIGVQFANVDSDLTNFPCYVPIKADADFHEALATGYDLRFTLSDGTTLLTYERELWTGGAGGAATAHHKVKVPSITAAAGADIYCYYGKAGAPNVDDRPNTWDQWFRGRWRLHNDLTDSTGHTGTLVASGGGVTSETGLIANGYEFDDGSDEYAEIDSADVTAYPFTLEAWGKSDSITAWQTLVWLGDKDAGDHFAALWFRGPEAGDPVVAYMHDYGGSGTTVVNSTAGYTANNWHYAAGVFAGNGANEIAAFLDGGNKGVGTQGSNTDPHDHDRTAIGGTRDSSPALYFSGLLDEIRISNTARSDAWIKFTYHNIAEADNELTWGAEEAAPTGLGYPYPRGLRGGHLALSGGMH